MSTVAKYGRAQGVKTLFVLARSLTTRIKDKQVFKMIRQSFFLAN